ncbi:MAG: hypothetical protein SO152_05640 [Ruminococcus sp.]|nr:hypothetical protein [Ruminococcus sp.]
MKKLISILLTIVTLLSALAVMPTAGAETSSSKKTTYIPERLVYSNKYGTTYFIGKSLVAKSANGEKVTLLKYKKSDVSPNINFYMRGKKVVYYDLDTEELYSIGIDGKNKKKLGTQINAFLGGYGDDVIAYIYDKGIYKINSDGKKIKLFGSKKDVNIVYLFGGKVYVNYWSRNWDNSKPRKFTVYDLKTKKTSTVKMYDYVIGRNHMYYKNSKNFLVQVDKNGVKQAVGSNVEYIDAVNNGATIVYSKLLNAGKNDDDRMFYRKTKGLKTVELCKQSDIYEKVKSIVKNSKKYDMDTISDYCIRHDTIGKNNVYFTVSVGNEEETFETMIIPVNLTTGKIGNAVTTIKGYIYNLAYDNGYVYYESGADVWDDCDDPWDGDSWVWDYGRIKAS